MVISWPELLPIVVAKVFPPLKTKSKSVRTCGTFDGSASRLVSVTETVPAPVVMVVLASTGRPFIGSVAPGAVANVNDPADAGAHMSPTASTPRRVVFKAINVISCTARSHG
jgi:hypothetical protein